MTAGLHCCRPSRPGDPATLPPGAADGHPRAAEFARLSVASLDVAEGVKSAPGFVGGRGRNGRVA